MSTQTNPPKEPVLIYPKPDPIKVAAPKMLELLTTALTIYDDDRRPKDYWWTAVRSLLTDLGAKNE